MNIQCSAFSVLLFLVLTTQFGLGDEKEDRAWFEGSFHENRKFVTILASGNGTTRNAHLTVYEVLAPNFQLRRLHSRFLLHQCHYTRACLCSGGRFFVTKNVLSHGDLRYPLVIYDLVRNEQTAYELDQLFSPDQQSRIKKTIHLKNINSMEDYIGLRDWSQELYQSEDHFDAKTMSFTLYSVGPMLDDWRKAPELLKVEKPFVNVVIDLPTRVATAVASSETKDLRPKPPFVPVRAYLNCLAQESIDDAIFDKTGNRILLPRMISVHYVNPESVRVYRVDPDTSEYMEVDASEWKNDKKAINQCSADHDMDLRERRAEQANALGQKLELEKSQKHDLSRPTAERRPPY